MARLRFTDLAVSRLKEPGIYYDTTTPAFGIRVGKNRKAWVVTRGKNRERVSFGKYPAMGLAEARKEAKKLLTDEPIQGDRITFSQAYDLYKPVIETKKPRTQDDYKRVLETHLKPELGNKKLSAISYEDVVAVADKHPGEKRNILAVARTFFRWCVKPPRRYLPHSPLEGLELPKAKKRKRILQPEETKIVWQAAKGKGYPYGTIVQLLQLTGQRRGEVANLRRPWINEKERTITIPDEFTKNKKEHTFPYGDLVAAILETVPRWNETDPLFPSKVSFERPFSGWSKSKKELEDGCKHWTLHDLRRTYRSTHSKIGTPREIAERLINHAAGVQTDVEAIYDRYDYMPEMRSAVEAFETHFKTLLARAA